MKLKSWEKEQDLVIVKKLAACKCKHWVWKEVRGGSCRKLWNGYNMFEGQTMMDTEIMNMQKWFKLTINRQSDHLSIFDLYEYQGSYLSADCEGLRDDGLSISMVTTSPKCVQKVIKVHFKEWLFDESQHANLFLNMATCVSFRCIDGCIGWFHFILIVVFEGFVLD